MLYNILIIIDYNYYKDDPNAFIFTLKNPHQIPPTRYMKRKESQYAIECSNNYGPIFGNDKGSDISISYTTYSCTSYINNDCANAYDCDSYYKSLLFTNSTESTIFDYEVYSIDYQGKETVYAKCKYPDIVWNYIQTNDISPDSLKHVQDDQELWNDFKSVYLDKREIRLKISQYYNRTQSKFLPNSTIVDAKYDSYLKEWAGNYSLKMIYRASEHYYTADSFHQFCDNRKPTLIVIKDFEGAIFGGYTTQSWNIPIHTTSICIFL